MPDCVRDKAARSARWSTMFSGQDQKMCSSNPMMGDLLFAAFADESTSSKRMASMLLRFTDPMRLTRHGCGAE